LCIGSFFLGSSFSHFLSGVRTVDLILVVGFVRILSVSGIERCGGIIFRYAEFYFWSVC